MGGSCDFSAAARATEPMTRIVQPFPPVAEPPPGQAFRDAMAQVASAVHVVTTRGAHGRFGLTATAVASVSDAPPTVLVCIERSSRTLAAIEASGVFCINTLPAQLVETAALSPRPDDEAVLLGADDVPEMLALVERNQPGPFRPRTHELGRYIGIRRGDRLVAMAGERLHPQGWTEISAVAVDDDHRRQGLASRLVLDVAFHIQQRGDRALLHAAASNTGAIAAYERLGFALRRRTRFSSVRAPL